MGSLTSWLGNIFSEGATQIIVSAVVTGAVTAVGVLIANVTGIVHADALGGLAVVAVTTGLKSIQKILAGLQPKEVK